MIVVARPRTGVTIAIVAIEIPNREAEGEAVGACLACAERAEATTASVAASTSIRRRSGPVARGSGSEA